jgi:transposase InsO family protein
MQQCTATVVDTMKIVSTTTRTMQRLAQRCDPGVTLSRQARMRQTLFDWHQTHGQNVSRTCRHFGISRPTFYRWQRRYVPGRPQTLEDRPCVPSARRQPSWTTAQARAVRDVREQYPRWGKAKLQCCLARGQTPLALSVSMVGRILRRLRATGQLLEPPNSLRPAKRCWTRPYGIRKPADYAVSAPGDLVQVDTVDVRPRPGVILKHFTAADVVSRWSVAEVAGTASASVAVRMLDALATRLPYPVRAIQVDGGSEFMAEFEAACQTRGIRLFVLPPRSPKLNGCVERTNRTWREEFYACTSAASTVTALGAAARAWETVYNTVRPHQALGYQTPAEWLQTWRAEHSSIADTHLSEGGCNGGTEPIQRLDVR